MIDRVGNSRKALEAAVSGDPQVAPAKKARAESSGGSSSPDAVKRRSPAKSKKSTAATSSSLAGTVANLATPVTDAVATAAEAVIEPAKKTITPVVHRVAVVPRKVAKVAGRGTKSVGKAAIAAPKAAAKRAVAVAGAGKSLLTGRAASIVGAAAAGLATGLVVHLGRKMVVQAPSALAGDWLEALKVEHRLALGLFDKLQKTGRDEGGKRSALLTQLKHALSKHAFTEENVIYPALRAWGDKADADKLNHDHGYVKQNLYDLEEMDRAAPGFLSKVASFRAELEEHIREEEQSIFPPLHAALGEAGNAKVTALANKEGFKLA